MPQNYQSKMRRVSDFQLSFWLITTVEAIYDKTGSQRSGCYFSVFTVCLLWGVFRKPFGVYSQRMQRYLRAFEMRFLRQNLRIMYRA